LVGPAEREGEVLPVPSGEKKPRAKRENLGLLRGKKRLSDSGQMEEKVGRQKKREKKQGGNQFEFYPADIGAKKTYPTGKGRSGASGAGHLAFSN